jgi:hypothetical protein
MLLAMATASALAFARSAGAEDAKPKRLAILPSALGGETAHVPAADQLFEAAARGARLRPDLEIVPYNDLFVAGTDSLAGIVRDCGADVRCASNALLQSKVDLGLRVIVNLALDPPVLIANTIDPHAEKVAHESIVELDKNTALIEAIERAASGVLDAAHFARGGRIAIAVTPADAKLTLPPGARADGEGYVVSAGRHEVKAAKEGFLPQSESVVVLAGEERAVNLVLSPTESSGIAWPWWIAGAGAVVLGASAIALVVASPFSSHGNHDCLCITSAATPCTHCQ